MIIDFHSHLKRDPISKVYDIVDSLSDMEKNGIDKRMISTLEGKSTAAQNDAVAEFVRAYPDKLLGCAVINPKEDDCIEEARRVAGIKEICALELDSWEHGYLPERYEHHLDPIFEIAAEYNLIVKLFTGWGPRTMPQQWAKYAKRHPNVTFFVLHMGGIDFGYGSISFVKENNNMMFETSGETELQVLHKAFGELPIERFVFGSNYPHLITRCSMDTFDVLHFTEEQKQKLFGANAKKFLKL